MKKIISLILVLAISCLVLASCGAPDTDINIGVMSGPTGMGMAKLMNYEQNDDSNYSFSIYSSPEEATAKLVKGEIDMLCLPTNVAANLYNKNQNIKVLAINTLGSLYLLTAPGVEVSSVKDLEGKTVYTSVPTSTTGPIINYILEKNEVNATIEFEADHNALAAKVIKGTVDYAILPEPIVTNALTKNPNYTTALNLSTEWDKVSDEPLVMGCIVVRADFLNENLAAVNWFLDRYEDSIEYIGAKKNNTAAAQMIINQKIVPAFTENKQAESALNNLYGSIEYIDGDDMKEALYDFYTAIGMTQPDNGFYFDD